MTDASGSVFVVLDGSIEPHLVQASLPTGTPTRFVDFSQGLASILGALEEAEPDLLLVGCADASSGALDLIESVRRRGANCAVVVLQPGSLNGLMEEAFRAGVDDLITLPQSRESLEFAFKKAMARRRGSSEPNALGSMICILGPKGGTGKTMTACNLAVALALAGKRSVLVDVDVQFGDVGVALGIAPERTIYDLAISGGSHDGEKVSRYLLGHSSGARVLLAPKRPDQAGAVETRLLRDVFASLRALNDFVIVDTPPAFSPEVIASIDAATDLCVVGMLDALSLKDTKIGLETLALMGYDPASVKLVLNRADSSVGISEADVERILGRRPDVLIPSDRAIPRAITDGLPIVTAQKDSGAARALTDLANQYLAEHRPADVQAAGKTSPKTAASGWRSLFRRGG